MSADGGGFSTQIKVRFSDVDRAGIAYYPRVIHWFHVAFEEFFEGFVGTPYHVVLDQRNLGFPAVDVKVAFRQPVRFGELLTVRVSLAKVGRSSAVFHYVIVGPGGDERATAFITVVCVALDTLEPVALPDWLRARFVAAADG